MTRVPRKMFDGEADDQSAHGEREHRPPYWLTMEPDLVGKGRKHILLNDGYPLEEEEGDQRNGNPNEGPEEEQDEIAPGFEKVHRVGRGRWGRRSRAVHFARVTSAHPVSRVTA
jgi:hypothetical protein